MLMATIPLIVCGTVLYSARVLLLCAIAMLTAKAVDVVVSMARHEEFDYTDHSSELSAFIFCLMLPVNIPVYIVVVSVLLAVLVGKHFFGGSDVYPFNLAALAMCYAKEGKMETAVEHQPDYLRLSQAERERAEKEQAVK